MLKTAGHNPAHFVMKPIPISAHQMRHLLKAAIYAAKKGAELVRAAMGFAREQPAI